MKPQNRLRRYHYKVYLPENIGEMVAEFISAIGAKEIGQTNHASDERKIDKRGKIPPVTNAQLFHKDNILVECYELLTHNGRRMNKLQKIVIRIQNLSDKYDYSFVVAREGFIVTNWINDKGDDHRLTKTTNYYSPPTQERLRGNKNDNQTVHGSV